MNCIAAVDGCQQCVDQPLVPQPHTCDEFCRLVADTFHLEPDLHTRGHVAGLPGYTAPCVAVDPDCGDCATHPLRSLPHICDDLCAMWAEQLPDDAWHSRIHSPQKHTCGAALNDRRGSHFEITATCGYRRCEALFCPGCRRYVGGDGPVGCPCVDRMGHGTLAEFKRPGAGRLVKPSVRNRRPSRRQR